MSIFKREMIFIVIWESSFISISFTENILILCVCEEPHCQWDVKVKKKTKLENTERKVKGNKITQKLVMGTSSG